MRKIIVNIATSADGFISRSDGGIDWLDRPGLKGDYGMPAFMNSVDTILYGRKTYDLAIKLGGLSVFGAHTKHYVFSRRKRRAQPGIEFVRGPISAFVRRLCAKPGKHIWMMGGAEIIGAFLDAGLIDEFMLHVIPVFIGEGVPLMAPRRRTTLLQLIAARKFSDGVVRLHYKVERPRARQKKGARRK
jgi:dihydrofolate reductase